MRKPTAQVRILTELQYYDDGSCAVIKSFGMPITEKLTKKKPKNSFEGECTGGVEL